MAEIEDAAAFDKARADESLYIGQESVAWFEERGGLRAILPIDGGPTGVDVRVVMQLTTHLTPQNLSVLWNDTRVRGMDFAGFAHQDARGRRIPTPHCQFYRSDGVYETEPLDVAQIGSTNCEPALRHFLGWCGITSNHLWNDPPPLQLGQSGIAARIHRTGRRRR